MFSGPLHLSFYYVLGNTSLWFSFVFVILIVKYAQILIVMYISHVDVHAQIFSILLSFYLLKLRGVYFFFLFYLFFKGICLIFPNVTFLHKLAYKFLWCTINTWSIYNYTLLPPLFVFTLPLSKSPSLPPFSSFLNI